MNDARTVEDRAMNGVVLFVDDEPEVLAGLRTVLRRERFRVLTAEGAEAALTVLESTPVDVVVSDEEMPGMKGTELLARVRERWPAVVRLVLTGHGSLESAVRAINEGGVYRYLTKPCEPDVLAETVRNAIATRKMSDEHAALLAEARRYRRAHPVALPDAGLFAHEGGEGGDDAAAVQAPGGAEK